MRWSIAANAAHVELTASKKRQLIDADRTVTDLKGLLDFRLERGARPPTQ